MVSCSEGLALDAAWYFVHLCRRVFKSSSSGNDDRPKGHIVYAERAVRDWMHAAAFRGLDTIIGLINQRDSIKEPLVVLLRFLYGSSPTKLSTLITKRIPKRVEDPVAYIAFAHDLLRNHTFMSGNVHYPIPRIMSKKGAELPPVNLAAIALVESRIVPDLIHMAFRAVEPRANIVQAAAEEGDGEFQFLPKENTSTAPVWGTTDQGGDVMSWEGAPGSTCTPRRRVDPLHIYC